MKTMGTLKVVLKGTIGGAELSPTNMDSQDLIVLLQSVNAVLGLGKEGARVAFETGSLKIIFLALATAIASAEALLAGVQATGNIDSIEHGKASALESLQRLADKKSYSIDFFAGSEDNAILAINSSTLYLQKESAAISTQFRLYGYIVDAGGKESANIHLNTKEHGILVIAVDKRELEKIEGNILYKQFCIIADGKQNSSTFEIEKSSLKFVSMEPWGVKDPLIYLQEILAKPKDGWADVEDPENWLREFRGYED